MVIFIWKLWILAIEIYRFKFAFAVFARKSVKRHAPVIQNFPDAKGSLFAVFARHNLGAKGNCHFRSRPNARPNDFLVKFFEEIHFRFPNPLFSCAWFCAAKDALFRPALLSRCGGSAERSVCESNRKPVGRVFSFFCLPYLTKLTLKNLNCHLQMLYY